MKNKVFYLGIIIMVFANTCNAQNDSIDYLGQKPPGYYPERFAPEIFKINEFGPVFSPDGTELFYTWQTPDMENQVYHINYMEKINGVWSKPVPATFTDKNGSSEIEPNFSPDGKRLYFDSEREGGFGGADIWYVEKTDTGWSEPINAGCTFNTKYTDNFPSFADDGSMFFCSDRNKDSWDIDIYYAKFENGKFQTPKRLDDFINNTPGWDANPIVFNDKLIVELSKNGGFGKGDIYLSQISGDNFGKPEILSANYNSNLSEWGITLSPDKKYLFFYHEGAGIYWVDTEALNYIGVKQEPFNYITSWYSGDTAQMQQALHSKLLKRRVISTSEIWNVTYDWMINAVKTGKGKVDNIKQAQKDIQILNQTDDMASVKLVSNEFVDYLHLTKFNNQWKIVNILWEYKKVADLGSQKEVEQLATEYINSWKTKDTKVLERILIPDFAGRMALSLTEVENIDYNWMTNKMQNCKNSIINKSSIIDVKVLDISKNMASVRIGNDNFVEYLHLTNISKKWYIVNSLRNFKITP